MKPMPLAATERLLTGTVAAALFAMMALTFVDVAARKLLGQGVPGSVELTELLMLGVVFAGMPLVSLKGEHVLFDVFDHLLPPRLLRLQAVLANGLCVALLVGAGVLVMERAARTAKVGDITARLHIGIAPFHYAIGVLLFVTAAMHVLLLWRRGPPADASQATAS